MKIKLLNEYVNQIHSPNKEKIFSEVMNYFPRNYLDIIKENSNKENIIQELSDIELISLKLEEKIIEDKKINYYDNFGIINEDTMNLISNLFKLNYKEQHEFLFGDNKFITKFQDKLKNIITIGYYDNNIKIFKTEILLVFYENISSEYINSYFQNFSSKGYSFNMENIQFHENKFKISILEDNYIKIGNAYKINTPENFQAQQNFQNTTNQNNIND